MNSPTDREADHKVAQELAELLRDVNVASKGHTRPHEANLARCYLAALQERDAARQSCKVLRASLQDYVRTLGSIRSSVSKQIKKLNKERDAAVAERDEARASLVEASSAWDGPETGDWLAGVRKEAAHQVARWGTGHDAGKTPEDWFWLLGYLAGKALHAAKSGDGEKALHHTISSGAALLNWHASLAAPQMRPAAAALHGETDDG